VLRECPSRNTFHVSHTVWYAEIGARLMAFRSLIPDP
jgi:hypothetical protein